MAKQPPPAPPPEALPDGEPNPYLAKFKASLVKRWSVSKSAVLYEMAELVACLWAPSGPARWRRERRRSRPRCPNRRRSRGTA